MNEVLAPSWIVEAYRWLESTGWIGNVLALALPLFCFGVLMLCLWASGHLKQEDHKDVSWKNRFDGFNSWGPK